MPGSNDCFIYQYEQINLRTGARRWVETATVPTGGCPSCCEPENKLLIRKVQENADCTGIPFMDEAGRSWRRRTTLTYADGNCSTVTKFIYGLPCSVPTKLIYLNSNAMFGQCRSSIKFETTTGGVYEFQINGPTVQVALPLGTLRLTLTAIDCDGDLQLKTMTGPGSYGTTVHISRQPPVSVVITDTTYGFYVDLL